MRPVCDTVANWLISHRAILAILAILLAAASVERSSHLEFARSIDTMFDRSDPALGPYRRLARGYRNRHNYRLRMLLAAGGLYAELCRSSFLHDTED